MTITPLLKRISSYGLVGLAAALVHAAMLLGLASVLPVWLSNLMGFLVASLVSYLGHALYTFRPETSGQRFARRWLLLQFSLNVAVSALLPVLLGAWSTQPLGTGVLVLTPTLLNALIWTRAAQFSRHRSLQGQPLKATAPRIHADDLGLSTATNTAILDLAREGHLDGASLLVNGSAAEQAVHSWQRLSTIRAELQLCLHLCLTEGPALASIELIPDLVDERGQLRFCFAQALLASLLPARHPRRRRLVQQLQLEALAQIDRFRNLTGTTTIALDGHQHIHLVPIVLRALLELAEMERITWLSSTVEPWPTGLPWRCWWTMLYRGGALKWLMLQVLSVLALPRLRRAGISSTAGFAGVLFTGRMTADPLHCAWRELCSLPRRPDQSPPMLLSHPGAPLEGSSQLDAFPLSRPFAGSRWRQREWGALRTLPRPFALTKG